MNSNTANNMSDALHITDLGKRYGTGSFVLQGLSYTFQPGEAIGLTGPNGSGKTTFIRLLSTAAYPTEGTVAFNDLNIHRKPHQYLQQVGLVVDSTALPHYLSAVELLSWILRARGLWNEGDAEKRVEETLDAVRLDERRENLIGTYSSGMLQKTLIAAALISRPAVMLLDEPLRALDEETRHAVIELLKQYKQEGGIVVISSHLQNLLKELCNRYITFPTG